MVTTSPKFCQWVYVSVNNDIFGLAFRWTSQLSQLRRPSYSCGLESAADWSVARSPLITTERLDARMLRSAYAETQLGDNPERRWMTAVNAATCAARTAKEQAWPESVIRRSGGRRWRVVRARKFNATIKLAERLAKRTALGRTDIRASFITHLFSCCL